MFINGLISKIQLLATSSTTSSGFTPVAIPSTAPTFADQLTIIKGVFTAMGEMIYINTSYVFTYMFTAQFSLFLLGFGLMFVVLVFQIVQRLVRGF